MEIVKAKLISFEKLVLYADSCINLYFKMRYGDKRWEKVYNISPAFFALTRKALYSEAIITICKLYESFNRSDNNLSKFINFLSSTKRFNNDGETVDLKKLHDKHREILVHKQDIVERLMTLRDKVLAHEDNKYFINPNKGEDIRFSFEEVCDLIETAGSIINDYNLILFNYSTSMKYYNGDDIDRLMSFCLSKLENSE